MYPGENLAVYDAAPRVSGDPPAADTLSSLRTEQVTGELPVIAPARVNQLDSAQVLQALAQVDEVYQAPVALFYLEDYAYKESGDSGRANGHRKVQNRARHCQLQKLLGAAANHEYAVKCPALLSMSLVAQISNLLYRRFPIGRAPIPVRVGTFRGSAGWKPCDTADWKSALRPLRRSRGEMRAKFRSNLSPSDREGEAAAMTSQQAKEILTIHRPGRPTGKIRTWPRAGAGPGRSGTGAVV